jgi:tRNA/rRNA methyltransferase
MVAKDRDRVVVVLVRARNPANIGAVARAMHDLGFSQLRVVNEYPVPFAAAKSAVHASSVLESAVEAASVAEAVADCTMVLGTTAVGDRKLEHPLYTLSDSVPVIHGALRASGTAKVALLFGSEKTGLSNDELSHCHALLTIPMNTRTVGHHLSMNLGQAAAVCLYAITEGAPAGASSVRASSADEPATGGDLERLTGLLGEVLERSGYTRKHPANSREANVRRMVRRMGNSADDAAVWSGVLRQLLHALESRASRGE